MKKLIIISLVCVVVTGCVTLDTAGSGASNNISGGYGNGGRVRERDYFSYSTDRPKTENR
jgi:hypothetical protein